MTVSPRLVSLLVASNVASLGALAFLVLTGFAPRQTTFEEIRAERINIVSPEGKTVIAISNQERIAGPVMAGKSYPVAVSEGREYLAGMIFFNQEGDEMGGLVFNSFRQQNGRSAGIGHLSFDRYGDNQVLALQYKENAAGVQAGLTFYDRTANGKFPESLELIDEARTASPDRLAEIKTTLSGWSRQGDLGVERLFIGSKNQVAQVLLKDSKGRVRARLMVDADDVARLEFLDDAGQVIQQFPD